MQDAGKRSQLNFEEKGGRFREYGSTKCALGNLPRDLLSWALNCGYLLMIGGVLEHFAVLASLFDRRIEMYL